MASLASLIGIHASLIHGPTIHGPPIHAAAPPSDANASNVSSSSSPPTSEDLNNNNKSKTFHKFAHLPTEIRLKIWHLILPSPETINICTDYVSPSQFGGNDLETQTHSSGPSKRAHHPILLSVCRESRLEILKRYQKLEGTSLSSCDLYMDWSQDKICFVGREARFGFGIFLLNTPSRTLQRVKSITIEHGSFPLFPWGSNSIDLNTTGQGGQVLLCGYPFATALDSFLPNLSILILHRNCSVQDNSTYRVSKLPGLSNNFMVGIRELLITCKCLRGIIVRKGEGEEGWERPEFEVAWWIGTEKEEDWVKRLLDLYHWMGSRGGDQD